MASLLRAGQTHAKSILEKWAGAHLQLVKERNTLENLLRQGREGVPVQPPLGVEGTRPAKRRRQVS